MRVKRKLKSRAKNHVGMVKSGRNRRVRVRKGNSQQKTIRRKRTAFRRMGK